MTTISIGIPDAIGHQLQERWGNISDRTLEALAVSAYRAGIITETQVQQMLNLSSRWETNTLLKKSGAYIDYSITDLEHDIDVIQKVVRK